MKFPLNRSDSVEVGKDDSSVSPVELKIEDSDVGYASTSSLETILTIATEQELKERESGTTISKEKSSSSVSEKEIDTNHLQQKSSGNYLDKSAKTAENKITHKPVKEGRQIFRWNLLFNVLVWIIISLPIWLPFISIPVSVIFLPTVQSIFVLMWFIICILACRNMVKIYRFTDNEDVIENPLRHLFIISCYKEPVDLIARSVQSIANQKDVHKISMTISFEEKTPDLKIKINQLKEKFENVGFERLLFAVHPYGLENEIPGKCSNSNHGFRESTDMLQKALGASFDPENIILTTCDADSHFPVNYTRALTTKFLESKQKHATIFQAPLFYNWGLDGTSFVTRVTGLIRSVLMMGALIPFNINSMSIFSFSLKLCIDGNYVHPAYQMDDIICLIRWMGVTRQRIRICALPVPVISGPTSGATVELDIIEWARQARRWTIGAAEVFHYYMVKSTKMPKLPAFTWGVSFLIYYGILLCSGALYSLSFALSMNFLIGSSNLPLYIQYWMYGLAGAQQMCFLVVFVLDAFATRALNVKEHICLARNIFQWILSPLVLLAYSLVEFYALHEIAIRGKKVCKHGASKKDALKT